MQMYVTFDNTIEGMLPYMICLDRRRRCVVLAVRGSMSVADVVTGTHTWGGRVGCEGVWARVLAPCVVGCQPAARTREQVGRVGQPRGQGGG